MHTSNGDASNLSSLFAVAFPVDVECFLGSERTPLSSDQ